MAETDKRNILAQPVRIRNQAPDVTITLDQQQIKEIAGQLDCGFRAFCHNTTGELVFIINTRKFPLGDLDDFEEDNERLEGNRDEFIDIFRQQWFAFKDQQYLDWVTKQLHANQIGIAPL